MISRRVVLGAAALAAGTLSAPMLLRRTAPTDAAVYFNGAGGRWQANARKAWFDPFRQESGISVVDTFPFNLGKLSTMVETESVQWDLTDIPSAMIGEATRRNILEPIDYTLVDREKLPAGSYGRHYVVYSRFSNNLFYNSDRFPVGPQSWPDVWDLRKFPGPRSLRQLPVPLLEWALIADGVPQSALYPIDVDRALAKLDTIKRHIRWWRSGAESIQLVAQGETDIGASFDTRIMQAKRDGVGLEIVWNQGALTGNYLVVPRGARNRENAMRLIDYIIGAEAQARMATLNGSSPVNPKAFDYIDPGLAEGFATHPDNAQCMFEVDEQGFWAEHYPAIKARFDEWLLAE